MFSNLVSQRPRILAVLVTACLVLVLAGAPAIWRLSQQRDRNVVRWVEVDGLPDKLGLYESVFWEPLDTESFRELLREQPEFVGGKQVLEIGTGSGLLAICCMDSGATSVVATDINPQAVACATANSKRLDVTIDFRLVPSRPDWVSSTNPQANVDNSLAKSSAIGNSPDSSAFSVIDSNEKFDLIVSNPPWEDSTPTQWSDFALYDERFELLRSILVGARDHLRPGGRLVLIYGCVEAIEVTRRFANEYDFDVVILDPRDPDSLPAVFLPGMMVGLTPSENANQ